jgi:hypothetical protein
MSNVSAEPSVFLVNTAGDATSIRAEPSLKIGRDSDNDLSISDSSVSSHHAVITLTNGVVLLQDLGSSNGTYTNDLRVIEALLKDGDSLRFGSARFSFHHAERPHFKRWNEHEASSTTREAASWWQRVQSIIRRSARTAARPEVRVPASPDVLRVLGRCSRTRLPFIAKLHRTGKAKYLVQTVTPIDEARTRNESFRGRRIEGRLERSRDFTGCPYCQHPGNFFACACCDNGLACSGSDWMAKVIRLRRCP